MFCEQCQLFWTEAISKAQIHPEINSCEDVHWTRYETVLHRTMRELKAASESHCPICRAILFTSTVWEKDTLLAYDDESIRIVLEIDPKQGPHPVLSVSFQEPAQEGQENKVRVAKRILATCAGLLLDNDFASTLDRSVQLDNSSTGSDAAFELASFWLRRCLSTHKECRGPSSLNEMSFLPTRLLDVSGNKIQLIETKHQIRGDADRRFVALSHCWGEIKIITTRNENYEEHLRDISLALLSKTFKEAVHATRKLGFRYIWIDSLCIKQNNSEDWQAEAATMCDVYRYASFTIAAAHASGGDVGCFEDRDGILQFPFVVDITAPESSSRKSRIMFTSYGRGKGLGGPEPPLYGRAWVLQEQLLSPRMLIFDGSQIRWECLCMHGSERSPQGGMSRHIGHQAAIRTGIMNDAEFFNDPKVEDRDFAARTQHQHWIYAVMDYTHRGMTKASDRLVALDGIARALSRKTSDQYLAGLWKQHFWVGLLWSLSHRNEYTPTTVGAFKLEGNKQIRHKEDIAPSWSWVSITAPVVYPIPAVIFIDRICNVLNASVTGSPAKQTGRAELRGHVRTGYVNSIYPYAIREAAEALPNMSCAKHEGGNDLFTYRGRSFGPNDFFIFSDTKPSNTRNIISSDWRLVRGTWRPDQIIDPQTQITFLAVAQENSGSKDGSLLDTHEERDPLKVYAIGLVPTGAVEGEYKRVGYAVWEDCAWYGYMCGRKRRPGRDIERAEGWRGMLTGRDLEKTTFPREKGTRHEHTYRRGSLPDMRAYDEGAKAEEKVVVIV